jgi:hypothetical protein
MYRSFVALDELGRAAQRIYGPFAYREVAVTRFVPVCAGEALILAPRHPVVWRRDGAGGMDLVAVRGLHADVEVPGLHATPREALPLLLQAFPLRFRDPGGGSFEIGAERTVPQREIDAGSYIFDERGEMLPGTELKLRALERWRQTADLGAALLDAAMAIGAVEPVVLPAAVVERYRLPDFVVILADPDDSVLLRGIPRTLWPVAARFLAAQRLSLHQMGRLIALAEAVGA